MEKKDRQSCDKVRCNHRDYCGNVSKCPKFLTEEKYKCPHRHEDRPPRRTESEWSKRDTERSNRKWFNSGKYYGQS